MMSHELRTPLNAIGGYAELIELGVRGPITPEQREDLVRLRRSQQQLLAMINDVLNFAKIDAGRAHIGQLHAVLVDWQIVAGLEFDLQRQRGFHRCARWTASGTRARSRSS